jgi:hypothetical protein
MALPGGDPGESLKLAGSALATLGRGVRAAA